MTFSMILHHFLFFSFIVHSSMPFASELFLRRDAKDWREKKFLSKIFLYRLFYTLIQSFNQKTSDLAKSILRWKTVFASSQSVWSWGFNYIRSRNNIFLVLSRRDQNTWCEIFW
jgi:hypothetical protein